MKKLFLLILSVMISTNAFAFGGMLGGGGHSTPRYQKGVSAYGIHIGGEGQVKIEFRDCKEEETWTGSECCPTERYLVQKGTCCAEGEKANSAGNECVKSEPGGSSAESPTGSEEDEDLTQNCPEGETEISNGECCSNAQVWEDENSELNCCPSGSKANTERNGCVSAVVKSTRRLMAYAAAPTFMGVAAMPSIICEEGYEERDGKCEEICSGNSVYKNGNCEACAEGSEKVTATECALLSQISSSCNDGYEMWNNSCVPICGEEKERNAISGECVGNGETGTEETGCPEGQISYEYCSGIWVKENSLWRFVKTCTPACCDGVIISHPDIDGAEMCCKGSTSPDRSVCCREGSFAYCAYYKDGACAEYDCCPDGGEVKEGVYDGEHLGTCCKEDKVWFGGNYSYVDAGLCGCPDGGEPSAEEGYESVCCKGDYAASWDGKYTEAVAGACGCPEGGKPSEAEGAEDICCKGDKAWNWGGYNEWNTACGCPDGGTPSTEEGQGDVCCKGNYALGWDGRYTEVIAEACGCPNGGTQSEEERDVCCKDNKEWDGSGYTGYNTIACGCPDGGTKSEEEGYEDVCCKDNKEWDGSGYTRENPSACGCPNGGIKSGREGYEICCKDNKEWDGSEYSNYNTVVCGCPDGGEVGYEEEVCCKDNKAWDGEGYNEENLSACGCPEGQELIGEECCDSSKVAGEGENAKCCKDEETVVGESCCPTDRVAGEEGSEICCENGQVVLDGGCCWSEDIVDGICCWQGAETCLGGCYEPCGEYGLRREDCSCGCEEGYTECGDACVEECEGDLVLDEGTCTCGCPDGGAPSEDEGYEDVCCKDNKRWDGEGYNEWNTACGCPDGGSPSTEEGQGDVCCKNNKGWDGTGYNEVIAEACGCPDGGSVSDQASDVCCKDNKAWDGSGYNTVDTQCGCPDGGSYGSDDETCCKDNKAWDGSGYNDVNIAVCGCPDGGTKTDDDHCCKDHKMWDDEGYNTEDPGTCGCPDEYTQKNSICCNGLKDTSGEENTECCESSDDGEICCTDEGYMWDSMKKECYPCDDSGKEDGELTERCCKANSGAWHDGACCFDDTGDGKNLDASTSKECCYGDGYKWDSEIGECFECNSAGEEKEDLFGEVTMKVTQRCCNSIEGKFYRRGHCCPVDDDDTDETVSDPNCCPDEAPNGYCKYKNQDGECYGWSCCSSTQFKDAEPFTVGICCTKGIAYCVETDEDGHCIQFDCCVDGTAQDATGKNSKGACCTDEDRPSPKPWYEIIKMGTRHADREYSDGASYACCPTQEEADEYGLCCESEKMRRWKYSEKTKWCCTGEKEKAYTSQDGTRSICCEDPEVGKEYIDIDGNKQISCCEEKKKQDSYGNCCQEDMVKKIFKMKKDESLQERNECCSSVSEDFSEECVKKGFWYTKCPISVDKACVMGCRYTPDCNKGEWKLEYGQWTEICQSDGTCEKPLKFTIGGNSVVVNDWKHISEKPAEVAAYCETLVKKSDLSAAKGAVLIINGKRSDGSFVGSVGGYVKARDDTNIYLNSADCVPNDEDRTFRCIVSLNHENGHRLDNFHNFTLGGGTGELVDKYPILYRFNSFMSEINQHREQNIKAVVGEYWANCYENISTDGTTVDLVRKTDEKCATVSDSFEGWDVPNYYSPGNSEFENDALGYWISPNKEGYLNYLNVKFEELWLNSESYRTSDSYLPGYISFSKGSLPAKEYMNSEIALKIKEGLENEHKGTTEFGDWNRSDYELLQEMCDKYNSGPGKTYIGCAAVIGRYQADILSEVDTNGLGIAQVYIAKNAIAANTHAEKCALRGDCEDFNDQYNCSKGTDDTCMRVEDFTPEYEFTLTVIPES